MKKWQERSRATLINDTRHICDVRWSELQLGLCMGRAMPPSWECTEANLWENKNAIMIETKDYKLPWEAA